MLGCREVWDWNRDEEMSLIEECIRNYPCIVIDTEFPGSLRETPKDASDEERYNNMCFSVDRTKLIQLGLTFVSPDSRIGGTWEINFSDFGEIEDARNEKSIEFLRRNGLDLEKIREEGIGIDDFFSEFNLIRKRVEKWKVNWVTFHGSYDIAYLLKYLTGDSLPVTSESFSKAVAQNLGPVYDLKVIAGRCKGLTSRLGLETLANQLGLDRVGTAHHAGSDSELTARVFLKMLVICRMKESEGFLYGLSSPPPSPPSSTPLPFQVLSRPMCVSSYRPYGGYIMVPIRVLRFS